MYQHIYIYIRPTGQTRFLQKTYYLSESQQNLSALSPESRRYLKDIFMFVGCVTSPDELLMSSEFISVCL